MKASYKYSSFAIGAATIVLVCGIFVWDSLPPLHSSFQVGMSKNYLIKRFGEPLGRSQFTKNPNETVLGFDWLYVESLPDGTQYEMWTYRSFFGISVLYFIDGNEHVRRVAFFREEVDYLPPFLPKPPD